MDTSLPFTELGLWAMLHGIVLGGGALLMLAAALFHLVAWRSSPGDAAGGERPASGRAFAWLLVATAAVLWLTVVAGTYVVFPPYRAVPPAGVADLAAYPKALLQSDAATSWLHSFAMEGKEHLPWIAAMLATAVAFVAARRPGALAADRGGRRRAGLLLAVCFALAAFAGLMGVLVDKVAPLR